MESEALTKLEYQYLENISKLEELTSKLEAKVISLESDKRKLSEANEIQKQESESTLKKYQEHISELGIKNSLSEKQIEEQIIKLSSQETTIKIANEKVIGLETVIKDMQNPEKLIRGAVDSYGRIHSSLLKYFLKLNELENNFVVGSIKLSKIFLGDGLYAVS